MRRAAAWLRRQMGATHRTPLHAMAHAVALLHAAIATGLLAWALVALHPQPALSALCAALIALLAGVFAGEGKADAP